MTVWFLCAIFMFILTYLQGGICREGTWPGHWISRYGTCGLFVLMCYGHSISSPSLTLPTNATCLLTYFTPSERTGLEAVRWRVPLRHWCRPRLRHKSSIDHDDSAHTTQSSYSTRHTWALAARQDGCQMARLNVDSVCQHQHLFLLLYRTVPD